MRYGNCWFYAIPRFLRKGGSLRVCWSPRNDYIPHCAWIRHDNVLEEFVPENPKKGFWDVVFAIIFKGKVNISYEYIEESSVQEEL